jgi:hypothetical protein
MRKVVMRGAYFGRYLPSRHLLFIRQGTLFAAPFDAGRMEVTGAAVPVVEEVMASPTVTGGAQYAVGSNGALVYVPTRTVLSDAPILWMDRLVGSRRRPNRPGRPSGSHPP